MNIPQMTLKTVEHFSGRFTKILYTTMAALDALAVDFVLEIHFYTRLVIFLLVFLVSWTFHGPFHKGF